jgi:hypothetical protein
LFSAVSDEAADADVVTGDSDQGNGMDLDIDFGSPLPAEAPREQQIRARSHPDRKRQFDKDWEAREASDVEADLQAIRLQHQRNQTLLDWEQRQLFADISNIPAHCHGKCECGRTDWKLNTEETQKVTVIAVNQVWEAALPRYVDCSHCESSRRINPLTFGFFPGNPKKEVRMYWYLIY